jgi:ketosteroid isomerase-like protein
MRRGIFNGRIDMTTITVADTREVVDRYYAAVNQGDWDSWLELFDDQVVLDEQLAGHLQGVDVLRGAVGGLKRGYSKFQMQPLHTVVEASQACVVWRCDAANASGVPISATGANYFVVEHGLITYMANFHDSVPFRPFLDQDLGRMEES